ITDTSRLDYSPQAVAMTYTARSEIEDFCGRLFDGLARAERPLILAGGGVRNCVTQVREFAEAIGVPVVNSLMATDLLPAGHPARVGMIGSYGNRWANHALSESDFLIVLGSRLDVRQTGA